jgi:phosphatidylserine/phosphatidylglycerophosphate/cardiolipin synthase-like enzyme
MEVMSKKWFSLFFIVSVVIFQVLATLKGGDTLSTASADTNTSNSPTQAEVLGVYFTPPAGAAQAIVKAIDASNKEVLVQAYGFTHNAMAQAIVRAHQRGVKVSVLLDQKSDHTNRYVVDLFNNAQVTMRQDGKHAIAHNKVMVIDDSIVITGSFNFTNSAETRNAENFLILKSSPLAARYKEEWLKHWVHGV